MGGKAEKMRRCGFADETSPKQFAPTGMMLLHPFHCRPLPANVATNALTFDAPVLLDFLLVRADDAG